MLQTQGIVAPAVHAATAAHILPSGAIIVVGVGAALLLEATAWHSWKKYRLKRQIAEQKQAELEQKVEELQHQYKSLKKALMAAQQPAKTASASTTLNKPSSGKQALFQKIINDNVAIREAANA